MYNKTFVSLILKVEESMENLEEVVRERNRAYFELETGMSGERERVIRTGNIFFFYRSQIWYLRIPN